MHEYSIVAALIDMCESSAREHNARSVERVKIAIGERSGVERTLIEGAFHQFKQDSQYCKDSALEVESERVELTCRDCGASFTPPHLEYGTCIHCHSHNVALTKGRELHLLSLELVSEE